MSKHPLTDDEVALIAGLHGSAAWRAMKKYLYWKASLEVSALNQGDYSDKPWTAGKLVATRTAFEDVASFPETLKPNPTDQ
jgi:hypothetical protein